MESIRSLRTWAAVALSAATLPACRNDENILGIISPDLLNPPNASVSQSHAGGQVKIEIKDPALVSKLLDLLATNELAGAMKHYDVEQVTLSLPGIPKSVTIALYKDSPFKDTSFKVSVKGWSTFGPGGPGLVRAIEQELFGDFAIEKINGLFGVNMDRIWVGEFPLHPCLELLYGLGYVADPGAQDARYWVPADSRSAAQVALEREIGAGLRKMQELDHVIVANGSYYAGGFSGGEDRSGLVKLAVYGPGGKPDTYENYSGEEDNFGTRGPMTRAEFDRMFPHGVNFDDGVGRWCPIKLGNESAGMPCEITTVSDFLKKQGLNYNSEDGTWN